MDDRHWTETGQLWLVLQGLLVLLQFLAVGLMYWRRRHSVDLTKNAVVHDLETRSQIFEQFRILMADQRQTNQSLSVAHAESQRQLLETRREYESALVENARLKTQLQSVRDDLSEAQRQLSLTTQKVTS